MKKILVLTYSFLIALSMWAQGGDDQKSSAGNDYRYLSVMTGLVNSFVVAPSDNNYVLLQTPYGDMLKNTAFVNYTPGINFNLLFHIDSRNDKFGFVFGAGIQDYGFSFYYKVKVDTFTTFKLMDQYRTTTAVIPVFFKYNPQDIYYQQLYLAFGGKFYYNFRFVNIQKANWGNQTYVGSIPDGATRNLSYSLFIGGNYSIYYFQIEFLLSNFINRNYTVQTFEGVSAPYWNVNYKTNFFITTGVHIPLTRWTTSRSWTAEKIRRILRGQVM